MFLERYDLKAEENFTSFQFYSEGPNGKILKIVQFTPTDYDLVYNLGFGDRTIHDNEMDDTNVSNNGDTEKILATVAYAVYIFLNEHPEIWVYATGSTISRNRLYRIGISKYIEIFQQDFDILGETASAWELFEKNKGYSAFLVRGKL